jgi:hypothetical protein
VIGPKPKSRAFLSLSVGVYPTSLITNKTTTALPSHFPTGGVKSPHTHLLYDAYLVRVVFSGSSENVKRRTTPTYSLRSVMHALPGPFYTIGRIPTQNAHKIRLLGSYYSRTLVHN